MLRPRRRSAEGAAKVVVRLTSAAITAALLAACASRPSRPDPIRAGASASPSYVLYPPLGTAAVENDPICLLAHSTAVPAPKRSRANVECASMLRHATQPITKPAMPARPVPAIVSTASPPAPECTAGQLGVRFRGGGMGTGSDFGEIVVWNNSATRCQLHGDIDFAAYYANGSRDAKATATPAAAPVTTLPKDMSPPRDGQDVSGYLRALLRGPERDDPAEPDGLCRALDEATPAAFVLSIGRITIRAMNQDPGAYEYTRIYGCHGDVLLEGLIGPQTG